MVNVKSSCPETCCFQVKNDLFWLAEKSGTDLAPKDEKKVILLMRENIVEVQTSLLDPYIAGYLLVP